jgi:hypothetical protein
VDCSVSEQSNQAGNGVFVLGTHAGEEVSVVFAYMEELWHRGGVPFLRILCFQRWRSSVFGLVFDFDIQYRSLSSSFIE